MSDNENINSTETQVNQPWNSTDNSISISTFRPKTTNQKDGDKTRRSAIVTVVVVLLRLVIGGVFIFSGWAKAVDLWGGLFKMEEYLGVWGMDFPRSIILMGASVLAIGEFSLGVMVLTGCFRRVTPWLVGVFMAIMMPLTMWIYLKNPVADCGCFGEALVISNGATMLKNIVLTILTALLIWLNRRVPSLFLPRMQFLPLLLSIFYAMFLGLYGYNIQPLYDFRPFRTGTPIGFNDSTEPRFVYEHNGVRASFPADSLPDDSWTFVERESTPDNSTTEAEVIPIFDAEGNDVTADVFADTENGMLILAVTEPARHGLSRSRMADNLYDYIQNRGGDMVAVIASSDPDKWAEDVDAHYSVYSADDTDLKQLARGEASLIYVKGDTIRWKYNLSYLAPDLIPPSILSEGREQGGNVIEKIKPVEDSGVLRNLTLIYIGLMIILGLTSLGLRSFPLHRKVKKGLSGESDEIGLKN